MKGVRYERRPLADLVPDADNPRTIAKARRGALRGSLEKFGQVEALVFNERTGKLIGGHQRRALLLEQGETEATPAFIMAHRRKPSVWTEISEARIRARDSTGGGRPCAVFEYVGPTLERRQAERLLALG